MLHTIHKSLEELLSIIVSMIPWPEVGSDSGRWPRLYSFRLNRIIILCLNFDCQIYVAT